MNIAIIYHDADFDGKLSNEVCRHRLKKLHPDAEVHSYGWDYGRPLPRLQLDTDPVGLSGACANWSDYAQIYIVDLSVDELMARPELRSKIVWIDHHKSAIEKWDSLQNETETQYVVRPFTGYRIDGVAACRLCWQWFEADGDEMLLPEKAGFVNRTVTEPELLRLAGEYDVWDVRDPDAKALQFGMRALSYVEFEELVDEEFSNKFVPGCPTILQCTIVIGTSIKRYFDTQNDSYAEHFSHTVQWEGLSFCCLNIGQCGNSDLLRAGITPEHDACMAWRYDGKQAYVSLYGIEGKDIDLSVIATKHGGGGHRGACGFRCGLREMADILGEPV